MITETVLFTEYAKKNIIHTYIFHTTILYHNHLNLDNNKKHKTNFTTLLDIYY